MEERPAVRTTSGVLRGVREDDLTVFRGVPYAAPPVGAARWRAAMPHPGWDGERDASRYGISAAQPWLPGGSPVMGSHGEPPFGEDCLTLNVWTPGTEDGRRPVLIWIHGGGFLTGSGNMARYATDTFARNGDLVAVSLNYRLGPLGYLSGMGDENVWLSDQVAALRWIAANITAFGGDPSRITIAGQSGGALSIAALAQHPDTRGLFQRAILQSPPAGVDVQTPEQALERTRSLARHLGHRDLEGLRDESWERLIRGTVGVLGEYAAFGEWSLAFHPVIDDATLPRHPFAELADADVDILIGWTADEATFSFGLDPRYATATREQVIAWAARRFGDSADTLYAATEETRPGAALIRIATDMIFRTGVLRLADQRAATRPVYVYRFDVGSPLRNGALGATHCLDLPFTFANMSRWSDAPFVAGLDEQVTARVSAFLHQAWIQFARTGEPSPAWPPYTPEHPAVLTVDDSVDRFAEIVPLQP
jgi:carboxylesterase type B